MRVQSLVCTITLVALTGLGIGASCVREGLLYPGDEIEETPPGYGLVVFGAEPSIDLHTVDMCTDPETCRTVGPFMRAQEAYLVRLPVGDYCMARVVAQTAVGEVSGGGSGMLHGWTAKEGEGCFRVDGGQPTYVGSFALKVEDGRSRLGVIRRPDIAAKVREYYPGL